MHPRGGRRHRGLDGAGDADLEGHRMPAPGAEVDAGVGALLGPGQRAPMASPTRAWARAASAASARSALRRRGPGMGDRRDAGRPAPAEMRMGLVETGATQERLTRVGSARVQCGGCFI